MKDHVARNLSSIAAFRIQVERSVRRAFYIQRIRLHLCAIRIIRRVHIQLILIQNRADYRRQVINSGLFASLSDAIGIARARHSFRRRSATNDFKDSSAVRLFQGPFVDGFRVFFRLLRGTPAIVEMRVRFQFHVFPVRRKSVSRLINRLVVTMDPLGVNDARGDVPFHFVLMNSDVSAQRCSVNVFSSLRALVPVPLRLIFDVVLNLNEGRVIIGVSRDATFINLSIRNGIEDVVFNRGQ